MAEQENKAELNVKACEHSMQRADNSSQIMQRADKGVQRKIWAFDSEFLSSGRAGHSEDVHSIQFSDGAPAPRALRLYFDDDLSLLTTSAPSTMATLTRSGGLNGKALGKVHFARLNG